MLSVVNIALFKAINLKSTEFNFFIFKEKWRKSNSSHAIEKAN